MKSTDEIGAQFFNENLERNQGDIDKALSETIQSVALLGLSRTDFFAKAAFYGGTALRLLFGLDRFSEDLDFSLEKPQDHFRLSGYFTALGDELESFGFSVEMSEKKKNINSPIESAFYKAGVPAHISNKIHRNAVCKVKLEIDTDPPEGAEYEVA